MNIRLDALADLRPASQHLTQLRCALREVADVSTYGPTRRHWPRRQCGIHWGLLFVGRTASACYRVSQI